MRLATFAAALAIASPASAVQAQDALGAAGPLRVAAIGQTRVVMVQGVLADPFVWEWTFLDEEVAGEGEEADQSFDTAAISVMYDCVARTRRALVLETYRNGVFVSQTPMYEEPAPVTPGTLADGALDVVCAPEANADGAVYETLALARAAMDERVGPAVPASE